MSETFQRWLMEGTTLPQFRETVVTLLETLIKPEVLKRDLFFALLLVLMNENDFLLLKEGADGTTTTTTIVDCITALFKRNSAVIEAGLILKGSEGLPIKLFQVPVGDTVLINAVIPYLNHRTFSICFPLHTYVVISEVGLPRNFMNLDALCVLFTNNIIVPVRSTILNYNRSPKSSLPNLPTEIVRRIMFVLPVEDILNLSESCKRINEIVNEDCLWFHLYDRDFADKHKREATLATDYYRDMYREKYLKMKEDKKVKTCTDDNVTKIEMSAGYLMYSCVPDPRWEVIL